MMALDRLEAAYQTALAALLAERTPDGHWVGELSTSALSTATAISALALVQRHTGNAQHQPLIDGGLAWLAANQNADGGWGDTTKSLSNISTSMLCRAALHLTSGAQRYRETLNRVETWLFQPSSGGYLEATPLTSFVTLSLAACGLADHAVAREGVRFLVNGVRPDGSWAIDSNLATWVTTLAINALAGVGALDELPRRVELV